MSPIVYTPPPKHDCDLPPVPDEITISLRRITAERIMNAWSSCDEEDCFGITCMIRRQVKAELEAGR